TAIRAAAAGAATAANWEPLIAVPMHPEYPCAHCTLGAAARAVLEAGLGRAGPFSTSTQGLPGSLRRHHRFAHVAGEAADSRIVGGIHYRNSWMVGAALGRKIGEQGIATILRPQS